MLILLTGTWTKDKIVLASGVFECDIYQRQISMQVSPTELEGLLLTHPAVLDVGVVGLPDEVVISKPKAFVVKRPDVEVTGKELSDHVAGMGYEKIMHLLQVSLTYNSRCYSTML